jgi:micrococcal nuclease
MRTAVLAGIAVLALGACRGDKGEATAPPRTDALAANATVEWVVDGDTIDVIVDGREERVRMIGIDTPEIPHESDGVRPGQPGECFGTEAQAFTATLLPPGTAVRLERDVVGRDDYGRVLAYVYRASDGVFVNYEMVRQGYAQPLTIPPNVAHSERFVGAARDAEAADAGLWTSCG